MWKPDNETPKYITHVGPFPPSLYRYRSVSPKTIDRLIDFEIAEECIFLAGLGDLNDPEDGRFTLKFANDYEAVRDYWRSSLPASRPKLRGRKLEALATAKANEVAASGYIVPDHIALFVRKMFEKLVRVACFTTDPANLAMWANYAKHFDAEGNSKDHAGICIEYECGEDWRSTTLHPVEYSEAVPEVDVVKHRELDIVRAIYCKSPEWRGECEWRISSVLHAKPPFPPNLTENAKMKLQGAIRAVIFGLHTPEPTIDLFTSRLRTIMPNLAFRRLVKDSKFQRKIIDLE